MIPTFLYFPYYIGKRTLNVLFQLLNDKLRLGGRWIPVLTKPYFKRYFNPFGLTFKISNNKRKRYSDEQKKQYFLKTLEQGSVCLSHGIIQLSVFIPFDSPYNMLKLYKASFTITYNLCSLNIASRNIIVYKVTIVKFSSFWFIMKCYQLLHHLLRKQGRVRYASRESIWVILNVFVSIPSLSSKQSKTYLPVYLLTKYNVTSFTLFVIYFFKEFFYGLQLTKYQE